MVRVCKNSKESVLAMVRKGKLDAAALSTSNLVDEIRAICFGDKKRRSR